MSRRTLESVPVRVLALAVLAEGSAEGQLSPLRLGKNKALTPAPEYYRRL